MQTNYVIVRQIACFGLALAVAASTQFADAQGTAFQYQGRLNQDGNPATGVYDFRFAIYDSSGGTTVVSGPQPKLGTGVTNGLFIVTLDFGSGVFTGPDRWLETGVRTNGGASYTNLSPRQLLLPTPYAIHAGTASNVASGSVVTSLNNLRDNVTLAAGANVTLTPSGNTLTIASTGGGGGGIWSLNGSSAYYNGGNVGVGTDSPITRFTVAGAGAYNSPTAAAITLDNTAAARRWEWHALDDGKLQLADFTAASTRLVIDTVGNVGIGVVNPQTTLDIRSPQHALTMTAFGPDVTFKDTGNANARSAIQSVGGDLNFFTESYLSGANPISFLKVANNGNVGIGNPQPQTTLDIVSPQHALSLTANGPDVTFYDSAHGYGRGVIQSVDGGLNFFTESYMSGVNPFSFLTVSKNGNVGIGNPQPQKTLDIVSSQHALAMTAFGPDVTFYDTGNAFARHVIQSVGGDLNFFPESYMSGANLNNYVKIANSGNVSVKNITIRGGADVAEPFEFSAENLPAGSVVIIDDEQPGKLKLSAHAYDTRVAGVVSGANGVNPGLSLHQEGTLDGTQNVSLTGRVYVLADATTDSIKPGDLLTTSSTPGHAMKAADSARAQGAILGKAMSRLKQGTGMVLVLVTLQ